MARPVQSPSLARHSPTMLTVLQKKWPLFLGVAGASALACAGLAILDLAGLLLAYAFTFSACHQLEPKAAVTLVFASAGLAFFLSLTFLGHPASSGAAVLTHLVVLTAAPLLLGAATRPTFLYYRHLDLVVTVIAGLFCLQNFLDLFIWSGAEKIRDAVTVLASSGATWVPELSDQKWSELMLILPSQKTAVDMFLLVFILQWTRRRIHRATAPIRLQPLGLLSSREAPLAFYWILSGLLATAIFADGNLQKIAINLTIVSFTPPLLRGLGLAHIICRKMAHPKIGFTALYTVNILLFWPLVFFSLIGLIEPWAKLRLKIQPSPSDE